MTTAIDATRAPHTTAAVDLDHAATTRLRPEVADAMSPFWHDRYGNPSGAHRLARDAVRALDEARERVASHLGRSPGEIVFTSGGTESNNHAVSGGLPPRRGIPVCSAVEHHAVLDVVHALGGRTVAVTPDCRVDLDDLAAVLDELGATVSVVSVMTVNNETGAINDIDAVARVVRERCAEVPHVPVHTDAVQAAVWLDIAAATGAADMVSISAHKLGGPKGVGALAVGPNVTLAPLLRGGGQERGRRSGTSNVAGIVGLAAALDLAVAERERTARLIRARRDRLVHGLLDSVEGAVATLPDPTGPHVVAGIANVAFRGVDSESLLLLLESADIYASAAASCSSGAQQSSHVLSAIGISPDLASGSLRLSLGRDSTDGDVERALAAIPAAVERIRSFG